MKAAPIAAWGRLLRISLSPSAAADVAAGMVLAAGRWPSGSGPVYAIMGSLCVYHGGLVLNDWADAPHDGATRPDRPIPSGQVRSKHALILAWGLLFAGPLLALQAGRGTASCLLFAALAAIIYDLWGRGPWSGPSLLATCRAANLSAGLVTGSAVALADGPPRTVLVAAPLIYALYVFVVSRLGRFEDGEDQRPLGRRPSQLLGLASFVLLCSGLLGWLAEPACGPWPPTAMAAAGAFGLARLALKTETWTLPLVGASMGACLRRLLIVTASLSLVSHGPQGVWVAALILAGYPLSYMLRNYFPPS